jgi:hypothetical protein
MAQNSHLIKTKDKGGRGKGGLGIGDFCFVFFSILSYRKLGNFSKKIEKLVKFTLTLFSPKFSTFQSGENHNLSEQKTLVGTQQCLVFWAKSSYRKFVEIIFQNFSSNY